jgi:hypothetical protein
MVGYFPEASRQVLLPLGRSDNCVKNHFYSKLRKSIRRLNKIIESELGKEHSQIKLRILYKII